MWSDLHEPTYPTFRMIRAKSNDATNIANDQAESAPIRNLRNTLVPQFAGHILNDDDPRTEDEKEDLEIAIYNYKQRMAQHDCQRPALSALMEGIPTCIHVNFQIYTLDCKTPYKVLRKLQKAVQPTSESRNSHY